MTVLTATVPAPAAGTRRSKRC